MAAATTTAVVALPGLVGAAPAGASPAFATGPALLAPVGDHVPAFTGLPGPAGGAQVLPLSGGRPVPSTWPRPHALVPSPGHDAAVPINNESTNWSGYVDAGTGARFTGVTGSWTVPTVGPTASAASSTWVGIDGDTNAALIQAGTEQDWGPQGVLYYAWYEMLPAVSIELGAVLPGDRIAVAIEQDQPGTWSVTVDDSTQHSLWTGAVAYSAPEASAEWIEEAPTDATTGNVEVLADYGKVGFSHMGVQGTRTGTATASPVYMIKQNSNNVQSYPAPYDPSTDSFNITYGAPTTLPASFPAVPIVAGPPGTSTTTTTAPSATTTASTTTAPSTTTTATAPTSPPATSPPATSPPAGHGYWLVGSDGGVFAFGDAHFHGSTGNMVARVRNQVINLAVVTGITPTPGDGGYWLATVNGGVFPFGNASYFGSLPAIGVLDAEVVGIVPTADGKGYFMVSWQGGVFAFGDAHFVGSCSTIGGCGAPLTALVPDASGHGYWLVLSNCQVVAFGDAPKIPASDCQSYATANKVQARTAVRTPDGRGYWVLLADGAVYPEGDAVTLGAWKAAASTTKTSPAEAIVPTRDGRGAWVVLEKGTVRAYGDAPKLGDLAGKKLSGPLLSAAGW
jgi:hypothetical protein